MNPNDLKALRELVAAQNMRIEHLERRLERAEAGQSIIEKAFRVIGLNTHYVEFGAFRGGTLIQAYRAAEVVHRDLSGGRWNYAFPDGAKTHAAVEAHWRAMRFFAFDSFAGIPPTAGRDKEWEVFQEGTFACTEDALRANLAEAGFAMDKLTVVPGFFEETCVPATAERIGLNNVGIVHIDSDLYASAKQALDFITPHLATAAIVIFDDWFQYFGHPEYGEQLAFREWREAHPEWLVTDFQKEGPWRNAFVLSLSREESFRRRGLEPVD